MAADYTVYFQYLNGNPMPQKLAPNGAAHFVSLVFGVPKATAKKLIVANLKPIGTGKATFYGNEHRLGTSKAVVSFVYYSVHEIQQLFAAR